MKPTINLYFDMEFTSLSPDAKIISLGIISDSEKSIYCEFTDFDIDMCDDWVKENVVVKLLFTKESGGIFHKLRNKEFGENYYLPQFECRGNTSEIKVWLTNWLSQFSDYQIQFVCDCGTFDWYHLLQLIGEWEERYIEPNEGWNHNLIYIGLPKLPSNISPVPLDLNDLIAFKKGITAWEAFELNREELAFGWYKNQERIASDKFKEDELTFFGFPGENKDQKHTALFDSKVIKAIYNKLISI